MFHPSEPELMTLKRIIEEKSYRTGQFTLASGKQANYFFDLKPTLLDPAGINLIADHMLMRIDQVCQPRPKAIGGMAMGGIPIVTAITSISHYDIPMPGFFMRSVPKDHGTERQIEGTPLRADWPVVLVEDVTTSGGTIMKAVHAIRKLGCLVGHVFTVIDRQEGATENLLAEGIQLHPLFVRSDFS